MLDHPPELSADLEWMLQSGQASREMLAGTLVDEFYIPLYRLGLALYGKAKAARRFAGDTLVAALLKVHQYNGQTGVHLWIYRRALALYPSTRRQKSRIFGLLNLSRTHQPASPADGQDAHFQAENPLHQFHDLFGDVQYLAVCLHHLLGLEASEIAPVLKARQDSIQNWLAKSWQIFRSCAWPADLDDQATQVEFSHWLQDQYPAPDLSGHELQAIKSEIGGEVEVRERQQRRFTYFKELVLVGFAILIIGGVMWGLSQFNPQDPRSRVRVVTQIVSVEKDSPGQNEPAAPRFDYRGLSTAIEPLNINSSPDAVQERMASTERNWDSMWQDVNVIFYGPPGYLGPPDAVRAQVWLDQSNQTRMIAGPLDGQPDHQFIARDKGFHHATIDSILRWYYLTYDRHLALGMDIEHFSLPVSNLARENRRLIVQGIEVVANHQALVVDQETRTGKLESRMWIDTVSGVTLRKRLYAPSNPDVVILDAVTTQVSYNVQFPVGNGNFANQADDGELQFAGNYLGVPDSGRFAPGRGRFANPITIWAPRAYRQSYHPYTPPPADFDPSGSRLTFQYIPTISTENSPFNLSGMDHIAGLFAGGYYLRSLNIGDPFSVICDRSPDGERLAMAQGRKSQPRDISRLTWVNLSDSQEPGTIDLEIDLAHFAFSPDNQRLALFGYGEPVGSLYVLNTESGQLTRLLNLEYVRSLMWAPDGEQLAIIGNWESPEYNEEIMVIDPDTGKVTYYTPYNYHGQIAVPELPDWMADRTFPEFMTGLEACAAAPQTQSALNMDPDARPPNLRELR
ncbi:MAG TPA: hypothetical protein VFZ76_08325 [Anaerolineales bacterium]